MILVCISIVMFEKIELYLLSTLLGKVLMEKGMDMVLMCLELLAVNDGV